jgi:hypothetical protein
MVAVVDVVVVDVAWVGTAKALRRRSGRQVSGSEFWFVDDVRVWTASMSPSLGLGEDAVVCCVDGGVVVE